MVLLSTKKLLLYCVAILVFEKTMANRRVQADIYIHEIPLAISLLTKKHYSPLFKVLSLVPGIYNIFLDIEANVQTLSLIGSSTGFKLISSQVLA